ncbi:MAG: hypothetical protein ACR2KV_05150 [Solirubrobacteraceae bacterium]
MPSYGKLALAALLTVAAAAPARAGVVAGQPLDGPSPDVLGLGGASMAADGGGAVAYLRADAGVAHVFVALLTRGAWSAPVRVDPGLGGPAAQPVIAASGGGRVAVAFLSGGTLEAAVRPAGARTAFTAPQAIAAGAGDPALSMGSSGTAYVAYRAAGGGLRAARLDRTATTFAGLPDAVEPQTGSGAGDGPLRRARIAVAADATGLVAWAEGGADGRSHVLARRVYGLHVGSVVRDATVDHLGSLSGGSADLAEVGLQDDSSYAWVAFREAFAGADGTPGVRALARPLVGSEFGAPQPLDGLQPGAAGPSLAIDGAGDGLAATARDGAHAVIGSAIGPGGFGPGQPANQVAAAAAPAPVAAVSRTGQGLIAFATEQGTLEARLFDGGAPAAAAPLSRADYGPVYAPGGLDAAVDAHGDAVVAFLQGDAAARRLVVAAVVDPPGGLAGLTSEHFGRVTRPLLQWTAARGAFSPISYTVVLDARPVGTTSATSLRVPAALSDGVHRWHVVAEDSLGQQTASAERTLAIAARPPVVTVAVTGSDRAGAILSFTVGARAPAGIARVVIDYGDRSAAGSGARSRHRYAHRGRFVVGVTVLDRVGNRGAARRTIAVG